MRALRGNAFSRYEQFETSPETIEQELLHAGCYNCDSIDDTVTVDGILLNLSNPCPITFQNIQFPSSMTGNSG